jgi:hypothetical protein
MVDSVGQWLDVEGYAKLVPVLDIGDVGTIQAVELDDHGVSECSTSFFALLIILVPSKEVAHAIKLFRHASPMVVREVWILCEESRDCVRVPLCFALMGLGKMWLLLVHFSTKNLKHIHLYRSPTPLLDPGREPTGWENLQLAP